jgi:probable O-glycosylation ligase (exosortase A-associated)
LNSAKGRLNAWAFAWNIALERPLTGGGFRVFTPYFFKKYAPVPDDYHEAHSIFLKILAEHGFPALTFFMLMALCTWRSATWMRRQANRSDELKWATDLASMGQVAMAGYAVGGAFSNLAYFGLPYHLMLTIIIG